MTAVMTRFKYEAETTDGVAVRGTIEATSAQVARNELALQGIRVTKITERKGLQADITKVKVPQVEIMHFSRQMASFLRAGVPVLEAIDNLRVECKNKRFAEVLADILQRVGEGTTVADAIAFHQDIFPGYYLSMLRSAEYTGRMDQAFDQLQRYIKRDVALTKTVRKALIYPAILLVLSIVVVAIIVIFVIPKFADFFESFDAELPLPTRMLMAIADFVGSVWGLITGAAILGLVTAFLVWVRTETGKRSWSRITLSFPALGTVIQYSATERFCRILAVLLDAGVTLSDALPSAIGCIHNVHFRERTETAVEQVLAGQGFAEPIASTEMFPSTMVQMARVGERTGELATQLENVAGYYEEELDYAVEKMTSLFEPVVIVFMGGVVGFVALAMVSAMYGIYGQVDLGK